LCRHKEQKILERQRDKQQYLREKVEGAVPGIARTKAEQEWTHHTTPWLERNIPVIPPPHAAASTSKATPKTAVYSAENLAGSSTLGRRQETKKMEVLSLKVGYSRDVMYALPGEVCALESFMSLVL
jgi:hypothetical protein